MPIIPRKRYGLATERKKEDAAETLGRMFYHGGPFDMEFDSPAGRLHVRVEKATHDR